MILGDIRTALQTQLKTISGFRAYDVWPDQIITPCALVKPTGAEFHMTRALTGSLTKLEFEILVLAAPMTVGLAQGQKTLDGYLGTGAGSIQNAVEVDQSLGGVATSVVCDAWDTYESFMVGEIEYVGVKFRLHVTA